MAQFLVLEEDRRQFEQVRECLLSNGHKAWRSGAVADAVEFLSQYSVDCILSVVALENTDVFEFLREVKSSAMLEPITFVFYCTDAELSERYATEPIMQQGKALGARKYILLANFDANRFWEQLQECIPEGLLKNDSLGGRVTSYPLTDLSWTR